MSVDAHCHIDLHSDPEKLLQELIENGVQTVAVTTTPAAFRGSLKFTRKEQGIHAALGMHPEVVGSRPKDMNLFTKYINDVQWIGEVGLDGSTRFKDSWDQQLQVFSSVLHECMKVGGKTLSIHSRGAGTEVLDCIEKQPQAGTPVLHWFSGSTKELERAVELGCFFSVNHQMLETKRGMELLSRIPLTRLLTESDAPFTSRDHRTIPERLRWCEAEISKVLRLEQSEVTDAIAKNFRLLTNPPNEARRVRSD